MESNGPMKALFIIVNAGFTDDVMDIARAAGAGGATIMHARGEGAHHESIMGITVDSEREIIVTLVNGDTAAKIIAAMEEKAGLKTAAHGVCFAMPVDKVTGLHNCPSPTAKKE